MRLIDHLAFLGRRVTKVGDEITFHDGLPPPSEQELADTYDAAFAAWEAAQNPPKQWPDTEHFLAEFTLEEMAGIGLSRDPTVAALYVLLSGWRSAVHSDDPRVMQGLAALVAAGIISEERKAEILR